MALLWSTRRAAIRLALHTAKCYLYDFRRFARHSAVLFPSRLEHLLGKITAQYHVLEKGLSMREPRPFYGEAIVRGLVADLRAAAGLLRPGERCPVPIATAVAVLAAYKNWHDEHAAEAGRHPLTQLVGEFLNEPAIAAIRGSGLPDGGCVTHSRAAVEQGAKGDLPALIAARHSMRDFAAEEIPQERLRAAVDLARMSPSVCNKQTARVYVLRDAKLIDEVLSIQQGARGFKENVPVLFVVAGDLTVFLTAEERNQVFFDCGLFAMNLVLGLQYHGIGSCFLHWCVDPDRDAQLMKMLAMKPEHRPVALVAAGAIPETFKAPVSQRLALDSICLWR